MDYVAVQIQYFQSYTFLGVRAFVSKKYLILEIFLISNMSAP